MLKVTEINDISQLREFRVLWDQLWQLTQDRSFFGSLTWLQNYWRRFGGEQKLRVLIVSAVDGPIGIVPLVVKEVQSRLGPVRALTYPLDSWGLAYGPIGPNAAESLSAALQHIRNSKRDWDIIDFRYVAPGELDQHTFTAFQSAGLQIYRRNGRSHSCVDIDTSWAMYWSRRSAECRVAYDYAERTLSKSGNVSFVRFRPGGANDGDTQRRRDLVSSTELLSLMSVKEDAPAAVRADLWNHLELLRDNHGPAVDAGAVDVNILALDDDPIACAYNYVSNGQVETIRLVADPVCEIAARTMLIGRMLQDSFQRGDRTLVFLRNCSDLSRLWQTTNRSRLRYTHFALKTNRTRMLWLKHRVACWWSREQPPRTAAAVTGERTAQPTSLVSAG